MRDRLFRLAALDGIMRKSEERPELIKKILRILEEEINIAKTLYSLARSDSRLGFEATQHYYYRTPDLIEKVMNCEYLTAYFKQLMAETSL